MSASADDKVLGLGGPTRHTRKCQCDRCTELRAEAEAEATERRKRIGGNSRPYLAG